MVVDNQHQFLANKTKQNSKQNKTKQTSKQNKTKQNKTQNRKHNILSRLRSLFRPFE